MPNARIRFCIYVIVTMFVFATLLTGQPLLFYSIPHTVKGPYIIAVQKCVAQQVIARYYDPSLKIGSDMEE